MVALAGLPPTAGFTSKLLVFSALWDSYHQQQLPWMLWLLDRRDLECRHFPRLLYAAAISAVFQKQYVPRPLRPTYMRIPGKLIAGFAYLLTLLLLFFKPGVAHAVDFGVLNGC
jgi:NADH-quinone oxidoreductase subunit N